MKLELACAAALALAGWCSACGEDETATGGGPVAGGSGGGSAGSGAASGGSGAASGGSGGVGLTGGAAPVVEDDDYAPDPDPDLLNPERGMFYYHVEATDPHSLIAKPLYLGDVCAQDLVWQGHGQAGTSALLDAYADGLAEAREAGLKVVFRPRYDVSGDTGPNACGLFEAESPERQYAHVEAIAAMLAEFVDVIALIEAGYLGRWGEWNWSGYGPETSPILADQATRRAFLDHVVQSYRAAGVERFVGVRKPIFHKEMYAEYPDSAPFVAAYNDCYMTNDTDYGTYSNSESDNPSNFASVDEAKQWLQDATLDAPHGGETCPLSDATPRWADCNNMVGPSSEPASYHTVYLHGAWALDAVETWEQGGCYDEIKRRLGYRFELVSVSYPPSAEVGQRVELELRLRNEGWARMHNPRSAYLVLRDGATPRLVGGVLAGYESLPTVESVGQLVRDWAPGGEVTLRFAFAAPEAGAYQLSVLLPDPDRPDILDYAVRLASVRAAAPLYDPATGENDLGLTITVD